MKTGSQEVRNRYGTARKPGWHLEIIEIDDGPEPCGYASNYGKRREGIEIPQGSAWQPPALDWTADKRNGAALLIAWVVAVVIACVVVAALAKLAGAW